MKTYTNLISSAFWYTLIVTGLIAVGLGTSGCELLDADEAPKKVAPAKPHTYEVKVESTPSAKKADLTLITAKEYQGLQKAGKDVAELQKRVETAIEKYEAEKKALEAEMKALVEEAEAEAGLEK